MRDEAFNNLVKYQQEIEDVTDEIESNIPIAERFKIELRTINNKPLFFIINKNNGFEKKAENIDELLDFLAFIYD